MTTPWLDVDADAARRSQLEAFRARIAARVPESVANYAELHQWACANTAAFWTDLLQWSAVQTSGSAAPQCVGEGVEHTAFFPNLRLNYARELLRSTALAGDADIALVERSENGSRQALSRLELRRRAMCFAAAMSHAQVTVGDAVVAIARNSADAVAACLGATAIGAVWSSVAPDLGTDAVIARFQQLAPRILIADTSFTQHGARRELTERIRALVQAIPSIELVVTLGEDLVSVPLDRATVSVLSRANVFEREPLDFAALVDFPFNHPLFVLFSSGTTGAPKCIVHGAGGTLLEHIKEHRLHTDLAKDDVLYFHTSCGWMMWNWQLTALASGVRIVLYDGSVSFPEPDSLLRVLTEERVTVFGTSPGYLQFLAESGVSPRARSLAQDVRAILSTGSVLYDAQFDWLRAEFKSVPVQSISGGTDIIGCFVLGNPTLPVYRGESQCVSLGMDVRVLTDPGIAPNGVGDLVCVNPFPSRPVAIWGDRSGERLHDTYYAENPGVWTHGDRVELTTRGSARILGRSDSTMKIRGVRIGPAEIYAVVLQLDGIVGAMAVEQQAPREMGGSRLVLLVVMAPGRALDRALTLTIKRELSQRVSSVHVPAVIVAVDELPQTHNGKFSERAARDVLNGRAVVNRAALKNPQALDALASNPQLRVASD